VTGLRHILAADGTRLACRFAGDPAAPPLVLLHATLSTSGQLRGLARALAAERRVLALDRRGSGASALASPRPVTIPEHAADVVALLDAEGIDAAGIVGHSFGGVVAIELAARHPARVRAVVAFEPPYVAVAPPEVQRGMQAVAASVAAAFATAGPAGAARAFIDGITAPGTFDAMPERTRAFLAAEGGGAYADAAILGLDPDALGGIVAPVTLLGGGASEPFYASILAALAARIPTARLRILDGLRHTSPITEPAAVAPAILAALTEVPAR
jgi:pimeloyl-ACP methyl ester carboxylesterase